MNVQFAIQNGVIYVLEVNPRASRTVPFVSKATGVPLAKIAARVMAGRKLAELGAAERARAALLLGQGSRVPLRQVPGVRPDPRPGDEITGEVMGTGRTFGEAYARRRRPAACTCRRAGVCLHQRARPRQGRRRRRSASA